VVTDSLQLPGAAQYDEIEKFESNVLDVLEKETIGALVYVETGRGAIQYYCYVRDVNAAASFINNMITDELNLELASDNDSSWLEYQRLIKRIRNDGGQKKGIELCCSGALHYACLFL
jgi:hypothetical protein